MKRHAPPSLATGIAVLAAASLILAGSPALSSVGKGGAAASASDPSRDDAGALVITNADLPPVLRTLEVSVAGSGEATDERLGAVYLRIRAGRLRDELRVAEGRIEHSRSQIEALTKLADALAGDGERAEALGEALSAARASHESARHYRKDVLDRWARFEEEARRAGTVIGRVR